MNRSRRRTDSTTMRRQLRGAIYVEALIVILVTTIIFAASLFLGSAYVAKLGTFDQATALALQTAGKGCGPPLGGTYSVGDLLAKPTPDPSNPDLTFLGTGVLAPAGQSSLTVERAVMLGSQTSWTFTTETQLMCNEKPMTADEAWQWLGGIDWAVNGMLAAGHLK
jgi:hypothetical protein